MAYKKNYLDEEQEGQSLGSGGIISAPGAAGGPQSTTTGSGWTNLGQYLDANKGETGALTSGFVGANQKAVDDAKAVGADLVKKTQSDDTWNAPINEAKSIANDIRTGDVTKVDAGKFGRVAGSSYVKPEYGKLEGYDDVLKSFSEAGKKVQGADQYDQQKATLQSQYGGSGNYGSGASTLDTFLLRADPTSKQSIQGFKEANKDWTDGGNKRFSDDVVNPLGNFFSGQESAFNAAKADMGKAVGDRRSAYENAAQAAWEAQKGATGDLSADALTRYQQEAAALGLPAGEIDLSKFTSMNQAFDAADVMSDADWAALAALEGLDGSRSSIQDMKRGDAQFTFDDAGANTAIQDKIDTQWADLLTAFNEGNAEAAERIKAAMDAGVLTDALIARVAPKLPPGFTSLSTNNIQERLKPGTVAVGGSTKSASDNVVDTFTGRKKLV